MNKYHFHSLSLLVGSARNDDRSCPNPRRLASRNAHRVNMLATVASEFLNYFLNFYANYSICKLFYDFIH
jgi:hypothetical protein